MMNVFLCDAKRALLSRRALLGFAAMLTILFTYGVVSEPFQSSVPVLCTLPYTTAWCSESQHRFVRYALYRSGRRNYILSKFLCCTLSGGILEALAALIYVRWQSGGLSFCIMVDGSLGCHIGLLLLSGALWAGVSAVLAAVTNSRYIAYGGAFVLYYFLVILQERYLTAAQLLDPRRWYAPEQAPVLSAVLQIGLLAVLWFAYDLTLRSKLKQV